MGVSVIIIGALPRGELSRFVHPLQFLSKRESHLVTRKSKKLPTLLHSAHLCGSANFCKVVFIDQILAKTLKSFQYRNSLGLLKCPFEGWYWRPSWTVMGLKLERNRQ